MRLHSILVLLRTNWLSFHFEHARLQGIGGPGAPHSIRLERIGDSGLVPQQSVHLIDKQHLVLPAGLQRHQVDSSFWDQREYVPNSSDVILRTVNFFLLKNTMNFPTPMPAGPSNG